MVNKPLIRPYFSGVGSFGGVARIPMITFLQNLRLWHPHEYEKLELYGWAFPVTWEMGLTLTAGWDGDGFWANSTKNTPVTSEILRLSWFFPMILLMEKNHAFTSWYGKYPINLQGFINLAGGCLGFLPSTVTFNISYGSIHQNTAANSPFLDWSWWLSLEDWK